MDGMNGTDSGTSMAPVLSELRLLRDEMQALRDTMLRGLSNGPMDRQQTADYLGVSLRTLDKIVASGDLVGARVGEKRLMFQRSDIDAYLRAMVQRNAS